MIRRLTRSSKKHKTGEFDLLQSTEIESSDQQPAKRRKVTRHPLPKLAKEKSKADQHLLSRPSNNWPPFDEAYDVVRAREIKDIISTGNWTYLCSEAVKHYASAVGPARSGNRDAQRNSYDQADTTEDFYTGPHDIAYDSDERNPFGFRYMLMGALPGKILNDQFSNSVPEEYKKKVVGQLAKCLHELSRIAFNKIGRIWCENHVDENPRIVTFLAHGECNCRRRLRTVGPFNNSRSYFHALRQGVNNALQVERSDNHDWPTWTKACQVLTDAIPSLVMSEYPHGPFPLWNLDWHCNNTLLDDEISITGFLDWSAAQTVPVEQFAVSPEFITLPGLSEEGNRSIIEFRAMFIKAWEKMETELSPAALPLKISDVISSTTPELIYRCISSVPRHSRVAEMNAELVQRLLNSNTKRTPYETNTPHARVNKQVARPMIYQPLRRSNRKVPEKPRLLASESLGPSLPSKAFKTVLFGILPQSFDMDIVQPQSSPAAVNTRRSLRLQRSTPSLAKDRKRPTPSKPK